MTNDLEAYFWISQTRDGRKIVVRQQQFVTHIWLLPGGDIKQAKQITSGTRNFDGYSGLTWTPDGRIVYSARTGRVVDLFSIAADGSDQIRLTQNPETDSTDPCVTPDGRFIVFASNRSGTTQIWRIRTDGRDPFQLTLEDEERSSAQWPTVSNNNDVFYIKNVNGQASIWKVSVDGGSPARVVVIGDGSAEGPLQISPDGKWLAYHHVSQRNERRDKDERTIRMGFVALNDKNEIKFVDLPIRRPILRWAGDNVFEYASGTFNTSSIVQQNLTNGETHKMAEFPDRIFNFSRSLNGKDIAVARGRLQGDALLITDLPR